MRQPQVLDGLCALRAELQWNWEIVSMRESRGGERTDFLLGSEVKLQGAFACLHWSSHGPDRGADPQCGPRWVWLLRWGVRLKCPDVIFYSLGFCIIHLVWYPGILSWHFFNEKKKCVCLITICQFLLSKEWALSIKKRTNWIWKRINYLLSLLWSRIPNSEFLNQSV